MSKRFQTDSLGEVELPEGVLYGAQTQRAIDNFGFSARPMPRRFINTLALIKKSAANINAKLELISKPQAEAIALAADQVLQGDLYGEFPLTVFQTGSGTSSNMNMNEVLANIANKQNPSLNIHPNDQVNYGQSSNDVIPATIQLASLLACQQDLLPALASLEQKLSQLSQNFQDIVKNGRTHLMDALPLSLGDEMATWEFQIKECQSRIKSSFQALGQLPLGGTAIGTGVNCHKDFSRQVTKLLSKDTGLKITPCENLAARISAQDATLELHGQLKVCATVLIKIANDLRWMNSGPNAGLAELSLKALQPGSSIMPGKVNPVIAEAVIMMATEVIANDLCVTLANQSGNFQLNTMLPLIADKTLASIELLTHSAQSFADKALNEIVVNHKKLSQQVATNAMLVTALNPLIGYQQAAQIAKRAFERNKSVLEVAKVMTDIDEKTLKTLLDPIKLAKPYRE